MKSSADIQQIVCSMRCMRTCFPNFSSVIHPFPDPLQEVYKSGRVSFDIHIWNESQDDSFRSCEHVTVKYIALVNKNIKKCLCIFTDVSDIFWEGIVTQMLVIDLRLPTTDQHNKELVFLSGHLGNIRLQRFTVEKVTYHHGIHQANLLAITNWQWRWLLRRLQKLCNPFWARFRFRRSSSNNSDESALLGCLLEGVRLHEHLCPRDRNCLDRHHQYMEWNTDFVTSGYHSNFTIYFFWRIHLALNRWIYNRQICPWFIAWLNYMHGRYSPSRHYWRCYLDLWKAYRFTRPPIPYWAHKSEQTPPKIVNYSSFTDKFTWMTFFPGLKSFIHSCIHCLSTVSGGKVPCPSGLTVQGTKPKDFLQFDYKRLLMLRLVESNLLMLRHNHYNYSWLFFRFQML